MSVGCGDRERNKVEMNATDRFAEEAHQFVKWILEGSSLGRPAVREAIAHLMRLYLAALELPLPGSDDLEHAPEAVGIDDENRCRVAGAISHRFPFDLYGTVFNPLIVPSGESTLGSLSDDLLDIYCDVATGWREYEAGRRARAIWEWGFNFRHHWGYHATAAIGALHKWLASEAPDQMGRESP